ncbi:MAG TPA: tetratricopeptide repeat protein, partial [Saprospiraceae bacterium]|nr:tetratricopeptide repeat protein [Saprospiraceae bacterium]
TVSIFSNVIVLNVSAYNDRFNYNPSLGVCLLIAWLLYRLIKAEARTTGDFLKKNILLLSIAGLIGLAGVVAIYAQMPMWKDRYALFAHDVRLAPNNARMLKNHGGSLAREAMTEKDPEKRKKYTAEATEYLERALKIYFRMGTGHTHLGNMYALQENWEAAEKAYRNALSIDSKSFEATTNLANVCYRTGRFEEAIQLMERLDKRRFSQNDYYLLYLAYAKKGDTEKANYYKPLAGK